MDRHVKIAAASGVLLFGAIVSLWFRHDASRPGPAPTAGGDQLILRKDRPSQSRLADGGQGQSPDSTMAGLNPRPATVLSPGEAGRPPEGPRPTGEGARQNSSQWGISMGLVLPESPPREPAPRTHTIVDGDTLHALAERYLGSANQAGEIFAANRDVLRNPALLPIGAELKIPVPKSAPVVAPDAGAERPVVPVN